MNLSALLDEVEQAINRGEYGAASQQLQEFDRELNNAIEETVEHFVKGAWAEWREDENREAEEAFSGLRVRACKLSSRFRGAG
jgi:hypothetical protein